MRVKLALSPQLTDDKRGLLWIMVAADIIMIFIGYSGEALLNTCGATFEV